MPFHVVDGKAIKAGKVTDIYFSRTVEVLRAKGVHKRCVAEVTLKNRKADWDFGILAGVEEMVELLDGVPVDVKVLPEGSIFQPFEPVAVIEGVYTDFAIYETALLGLLCQASGVATEAARCKLAAGDKLLISFGARRMHPAIAPMIERNAFIGGCDGVAVVASAELIHEEPVGTIPHALVLMLDGVTEATLAFHEVIDPSVHRVALVDTFCDEKIESLRAAEALGESLWAVRLDTPGSRRGNLRQIIDGGGISPAAAVFRLRQTGIPGLRGLDSCRHGAGHRMGTPTGQAGGKGPLGRSRVQHEDFLGGAGHVPVGLLVGGFDGHGEFPHPLDVGDGALGVVEQTLLYLLLAPARLAEDRRVLARPDRHDVLLAHDVDRSQVRHGIRHGLAQGLGVVG